MTGLDTNLLVRYLTQDDAKQAKLAEERIEHAVTTGEKLLIHPLILCELVWMLQSAYEADKAEVLRVLEGILRTAQFEIADKDTVWQAFADYRQGKADFADYYLGRANAKLGAALNLTFDKTLRGTPRFRVPTA